jgi:hypothetical protein
LLKLIATMVIAVTVAVTPAKAAQMRLPHKPFTTMTRTQMIHYLKLQRFHDKAIIRFWRNHRQLQSASAVKQVKWAQRSLRIVQGNLHKLLTPRISGGHTAALMCIHSYEGSWTDPGSPYWGGLQMDMNFQSTYGPEFLNRWGTADNWPVWAQLRAAERAIAVRGFSPWPNTARYCGLL